MSAPHAPLLIVNWSMFFAAAFWIAGFGGLFASVGGCLYAFSTKRYVMAAIMVAALLASVVLFALALSIKVY